MRLPKREGFTREDRFARRVPLRFRLLCVWGVLVRLVPAILASRSFAYVVVERRPHENGANTTSVMAARTPVEAHDLARHLRGHYFDYLYAMQVDHRGLGFAWFRAMALRSKRG